MKKEILLKDSIIDKLETNFIDENNKTHEQVRYSFTESCKGRSCQGLLMFHKRKTKRKVMVLDYWLNDNIERKLKNGKIPKKIKIKSEIEQTKQTKKTCCFFKPCSITKIF